MFHLVYWIFRPSATGRPKPELVVGDVEYFSVESITGNDRSKWAGLDAMLPIFSEMVGV